MEEFQINILNIITKEIQFSKSAICFPQQKSIGVVSSLELQIEVLSWKAETNAFTSFKRINKK
jgi:septum formation topological specificity factor MinE